ncbi:hypothetical protein CYYG_00007 [Cyanophage SS120-1]|uniref:Uncharacterized protein n=1 Tax=Cyanophage SS120-1 TaxID=616674 RepID=M1TVQ8_9CAUD|nr:hypothetical protein CYYG_00007 [Cyanophage SS120-1]AGG54509.1 hypothetical protein CYYG_00007 [Cyanophage SS120-1]
MISILTPHLVSIVSTIKDSLQKFTIIFVDEAKERRSLDLYEETESDAVLEALDLVPCLHNNAAAIVGVVEHH